MPLAPGTRIGPFEILNALGAGGMGEVFRARDVRLDRSVAIKALPVSVAADPDRLARFEREARLLAALEHPNIAGIHGLEEADGAPYLVLEFVDGQTLAERLASGPLTVSEVLTIGAQIASAIEAAHERGIVHRDLKPGNVMVTRSGTVKVLDFGLAKGDAAAVSSADLSASPTVALAATGTGMILGTAPYMSPEQARGRGVDRRTDVWAFGCVLFECLTGRAAFGGETVSDVIARILERDADWSALPGGVPPRLRELVGRCLTKEVADRPRDIGDLGRELTAIALERSSGPMPAAGGSVPSLAVLYFENLTRDPESDYFCAGITEDIVTDLSKIKGLRVASRNAVARYRGAPAEIARVASELHVQAVLEGSVRRAGERVRITAQLVNASDGFQLWAERYDRTLQDVFAVQEEIASSIAEALRVALTPSETARLVHHRPKDVRAYDLYLKGREQYSQYTADSIRRALELFQQALEADPDYALAWAGVADCHGQMCQWGITEDPTESLRLGLEAARRATAIDPRLPEGYKAEALVLRFSGDADGSRAALLKAVEVNPRFTPALINLAVESFTRADLAGTERFVRRALEVDPQETFAVSWLGWLAQLTGRDAEAIALSDRMRRLSDDAFYVTVTYVARAMIHLGCGDLAAAARAVEEGRADGANSQHLESVEAAIAAREGRVADARRLIAGLEDVSIGAGSLLLVAGAAVRIGDPEAARRFMSRPIIGDLARTLMRLDPELHPLLDHAPFAPRRWAVPLVWPLEAPMIDAARFALFQEMRVESGRPPASQPAH